MILDVIVECNGQCLDILAGSTEGAERGYGKKIIGRARSTEGFQQRHLRQELPYHSVAFYLTDCVFVFIVAGVVEFKGSDMPNMRAGGEVVDELDAHKIAVKRHLGRAGTGPQQSDFFE